MTLDVQKLGFSYNERQVLHDVGFHIHAGELVAILGPNGVGKTTLLKCLNAIHKPSGGAVMVERRNLLTMTPHEIALKVGYVAQRSETARMTVFDAVLMGRKPHIRWNASERDLTITDTAIRRLGLEGLALRYVDQLSGGELQKVCIARAMVQEPQLLLLDEPTSSLDMRSQIEIMKMLRHVIDGHGIAAVMTMHDLNTALRYADRALFVKGGTVFAEVAVADVCSDVIEAVYGVSVTVHNLGGVPTVVPAA
ncbi:ABC transporter ATP-binding protein [Oleidesulfovibrio sp.]|uniref:ABC transporter ATP-binding protein n=1 Tax=Oleidesulfovibrio sp. TaxID=2909707 RepID=UPI003A868E0D